MSHLRIATLCGSFVAMEIQPVIFCALLGCLISFLIIPLARLRGLLRSVAALHGEELIRQNLDSIRPKSIGGIAVATSFVSVVCFIVLTYPAMWTHLPSSQTTIVWVALAIFGVGLWDDHRPMGRPWRLVFQIAVAMAGYAKGLRIDDLWSSPSNESYHSVLWSMPLTVIWMVGLTNVSSFAARYEDRPGGKAVATVALFAVLLLVGAGSQVTFAALCALGAAGGLAGCLLCGLSSAPARLGGAGAGFVGSLVAGISAASGGDGSSASAATTSLLALGSVVFWFLALRYPKQNQPRGFTVSTRFEKPSSCRFSSSPNLFGHSRW